MLNVESACCGTHDSVGGRRLSFYCFLIKCSRGDPRGMGRAVLRATRSVSATAYLAGAVLAGAVLAGALAYGSLMKAMRTSE